MGEPTIWDFGKGDPAAAGQSFAPEDLPPRSERAARTHRDDPANLVGDSREELVIWDPTATHWYMYTPKSLNESLPHEYRHEPRQYNPRLMD